MNENDKSPECLKKRLLVENIKAFDLYKLSVEQLLDVVGTLDEKWVNNEWRNDDKCIIDKYVDLQQQINWVKTLKIGDKVAFKDGSGYEITEIIDTNEDGTVRMGLYTNWLDVSGNYNGRSGIVPLTQEIFDAIEKEKIVYILYKETRYRNIPLTKLQEVLTLVKENGGLEDDE